MRRHWSRILLCIAACAGAAASQIITFNGPMPWVTQRNDSITIRAQIDTAQVKNKDFSLSVDLINERGQKKSLKTKSFPIKDYTVEFPVGALKEYLVGGRSYIKIDWSISGTANKGSIAPIGIVALDKLPQAEANQIVHAAEGADPAGIAASLKDADYKAAGSDKFAFAWNKSAFFIILQKNERTAPGTIRFAFDGKNGKNAFLSFSDRVVMYNGVKDSLFGLHYSQQLAGDTIKYLEKAWPNELTKTVTNDRIVIRVPWYDVGIVTCDSSGIQKEALPKKAEFYNPGTWSDFQLSK